MKTVIKNGTIVDGGKSFIGTIIIEENYISKVVEGNPSPELLENVKVIDAKGCYVIPGAIDTHVHFREPGLTRKGDWKSESRAAVAGGVTSVMDMPNTIPQTTSEELMWEKKNLAAEHSLVNYAAFIGATSDNISQLKKLDPNDACGVKVFMGSSTGNMLLDNDDTLRELFAECPMPIVAHCEDDAMIKQNMEKAQQEFGNDIPFRYHPIIRSAEACYRSTAHAVEMAEKYGTKLHVAHLSTAKEVGLFSLDSKITAEACVHYLWFSDADYNKKGSFVKCNPAIKTITDRDSLRKAFATGLLSTLATDHAPHTLEEKKNNYVNAPSGMPLIQHSLHAMLELCIEGHFSLETLVERACHAPARIFNIQKRGFIRSGYFADIAIISPNSSWMVEKGNIVSKCGWSPFEDEYFSHKVTHTFVNGKLVFEHGKINAESKGMALEFDR